jgi:hypothetical protein
MTGIRRSARGSVALLAYNPSAMRAATAIW